VYYPGETPTFTWIEAAFAGTYEVRDYFGTVVSSGGFADTQSLQPDPPVGGWELGWYRLTLKKTGASDPVFADSFGSANFVFVTDDNRFVRPAGHTTDPGRGGEFPDPALKGFLGIGTSRIQIADAADPTALIGGDDLGASGAPGNFAISNTYWTTGPDFRGNDPVRPRYSYASFPNQANDKLVIGTRLVIAFKSGAAAAAGSVSVVIAAGTSSGIKLTFTQGATVETWDNVVATVIGVLTHQIANPSNIVRVYKRDDQSSTGAVTTGSGTLSNAMYLGVKLVVETCWPLGVEWYEGPDNEPDIRKNPVRYANDSFMFHEAVKAGNAGAKVFGPSVINISPQPVGANEVVLGINALYHYLVGIGSETTDGPIVAAKDYVEGIGIHIYNMPPESLDLARNHLDQFVAMLEVAGCGDKPIWQGEAGVDVAVREVYHPRHAHTAVFRHLILEQYGIDREHNNLWYDASHGFWSVPQFWRHGAQSLAPHALMIRVMAEEQFGKAFESRLDFGTGVGEHLFVGSTYVAPDGTRLAVVCAASHLDDADMVFQLEGALPSNITYRDGLGRHHTVDVDPDDTITVPVTAEPTWVRLPAGVTATVKTFLGLYNPSAPNVAGRHSWASFDGIHGVRPPNDDGYWLGNGELTTESTQEAAPANLTIHFDTTRRVTDVVLFSGFAWQAQCALADFDIQTSTDGGGSWTTRATVTKNNLTSFFQGASSSDSGTTRVTYWDEQFIFPVKLPAPAKCNALRVVVRATSFGGEPDAAAHAANGQGSSTQNVMLSEVYVIGDTPPTLVAVAG
jgi:hypothetical protein